MENNNTNKIGKTSYCLVLVVKHRLFTAVVYLLLAGGREETVRARLSDPKGLPV